MHDGHLLSSTQRRKSIATWTGSIHSQHATCCHVIDLSSEHRNKRRSCGWSWTDTGTSSTSVELMWINAPHWRRQLLGTGARGPFLDSLFDFFQCTLTWTKSDSDYMSTVASCKNPVTYACPPPGTKSWRRLWPTPRLPEGVPGFDTDLVITGPPNRSVLFCSLASVGVCRLSSSVTLLADRPAAGRAGGRAADTPRRASSVTSRYGDTLL